MQLVPKPPQTSGAQVNEDTFFFCVFLAASLFTTLFLNISLRSNCHTSSTVFNTCNQ